MPNFYTCPDMNFDRSAKKILIRNADWTHEQIQFLVNNLSEKEYDIYLYHDGVNDIQWFEGIRSMTPPNRVYDYKQHIHRDTFEWLKEIDDEL
jgi:hypothetical protein